ncbi:transcriptional regulator [Paenibacillus albiflavus]|uniref:Transcriptional regulator n=1 Tax=Paenibacillus albiflavus TaxID=2545760 RepID=A0A4V2WPL6_9BACL|nr:transcriptional regulator [Paenibacillus albiflavus]
MFLNNKQYYCPVEATVDAIGGKWKARIMWHLSNRKHRYGELNKLIPEISRKMLAQALRELESDGLISRSEYSEKILKVEYELTDYGRSLTPILTLMSAWGKEHILKQRELITEQKEEPS